MTPEEALTRGKSYLDEATENITFDEFTWAFEEACRGVAWVLDALAEPPDATLDLGPKGELLAPGTLERLLAKVANPPKAARVVARLEALLAEVAGIEGPDALDAALAARSERVVELVFAAWELLDACGTRLGLVDERLGDKLVLTDPSPGRVGSQPIRRRTALKLLAASSVFPLAACRKVERDNRPPRVDKASAKTSASARPTAQPTATVRAVTPLGGMHFETSDPFLFCAHHFDEYPEGNDEMGPNASLAGRHLGRDFAGKDNWRMYHGREVPGFPRHPHRGFETVTVVRTGMLDHSDSMGAAARYGAGDVQWLTAGGGIQHAEMFPLLRSDSPNPLELFQIWLNLPASDKLVDPHFTMLWNEKIPRVVEEDDAGKIVELTLAAGGYGDHTPPSPPPNSWASRAEADVAIWSIKMEAGATFQMPAVSEGTERSLYVHEGAGVRVGDTDVPNARRVQLDGHGPIELAAGGQQTEILLLQGRPIGEPVAKRGPFVMNSQQEIRQAYLDYQRTQFGGWPWGENDPVHQRTKGRFARHIDGRFEEPT
nr:pirin-like C-terminal cupin domain-containing protein [Persicimonas caeni]